MVRMKGRNKYMKHKNSKIGEYGIKWEPVEGYTKRDGRKVPSYLKKVEFRWKNNN